MRPAKGFVSLPVMVLTAALAVAVGVSGYTFVYARGGDYFADAPASCANCHVMQPHFDGWMNGPHHAAATCNDCHTPPGKIAKTQVKAANGWNHSKAFTTGAFPDAIQMRASSRAVVEANCRNCHADLVDGMTSGGEVSCIRCHDSVGHLK